MAMHNESDTENIFLRSKIHQQIQKGRKSAVNFFKKIPNLLESGSSTCRISPHWTCSSVKIEKAKTLKILRYNI